MFNYSHFYNNISAKDKPSWIDRKKNDGKKLIELNNIVAHALRQCILTTHFVIFMASTS